MISKTNFLPKIAQKIEVQELDSNKIYISRVADLSDDFLGVDIPVDKQSGRIHLFNKGMRLKISYIVSNGNKYQYETEVIGLQKGRLSFLLTSLPKEEQIHKIQLRNFLRVPSYLPIQINVSKKDNIPTIKEETVDISGGGLSFSCDAALKLFLKEQVVMLFSVPLGRDSNYEVIAHGEIVRVDPPREKGLKQIIAVEFTNIREVDRDRIVRHCFERQLELRNKL